MQSHPELQLDGPFNSQAHPQEALVQDRPTLGAMPMARRGAAWWLVPAIDFAVSSLAVLVVTLIEGVAVFPAFPVASLILVGAYGILGDYSSSPSHTLGTEDGAGWPAIRLVVAALFAWVTSLLTPLGARAQLGLWAGFVLIDTLCRAVVNPYLRSLSRQERWVLVGEDSTAERLRAYAPLKAYADVVGTIQADHEGNAGRVAALEAVERFHADRVVISTQHADDEGLLELVRNFKSIGVPVSLLPRPLDLLEAQSVTPNRVGGVPLIDVEALAARGAVPYAGPDRRQTRKTKVSVVVPAMNEEKNIGHVLEQLPEGLHEVILVDGNSKDNTIEAARAVRPDIRVTSQSGRGKGDAFRTGFAAVTGNLVVMLDADGSADPAEIPRFVAALEGGADFAKGSRFLPGGGSADITPTRKLGNAVLSGTANVLHGTRFTDLCYGYNAFWTRCLPWISLDVPGFEVETLINLRIAAAGMKITEVPSYEKDRLHGESNLKTFRDGFRVLGTIFKEARRRRSLRGGAAPTAEPFADEQSRSKAAA
ncbi:MAG TPA: glycosyltransferase family 2 protein [Solirubrobacterales bacterium]|jgi:hypothetical protein